MIRGTEGLAELGGLISGQLDGLFIAQGQTQHRLADLLRNHRYGELSTESLMKVANKAVAYAKQLVRCGARHGYFDSILEAPPEGPKISFHDR
jgi:hypothetical protein